MTESIITGIKDLLKFNIISNVNTGDKTQDNLLNVVILSFLSAIFTPGLQYQIQMLFSKLTSNEETIIKDNGKRLVRSVSPEEGTVVLSKNKLRKRRY